jgi:hypothetical protein
MWLRSIIRTEMNFWWQCLPVAQEMAQLHGWSFVQSLAKLQRGKRIAGKLPIEFSGYGFDWVAEAHWPEFMGFGELSPFQRAGLQIQDRINQSDKACMATFLAQSHIATPPLQALIMRDIAEPTLDVIRLNTQADVWAQLKNWCEIGTNILLKPCFGTHGSGVWAIKNGLILNEHGASTSLESAFGAIAAAAQKGDGYGYLAQALLSAHPTLQQLNGIDTLCTLRLYTLNNGTNIAVPFAELKMPRLGNITDNILDGKRGNIVCPVVMDSGQTEAAWAIVDPKLRYCQQRLSHHPETNARFTDFVVPHWAEAIDLAKRTAKIYPVSPMLGLDIAITKDGCAVLDVNNQTSTPWIAGDHGTRPYLADFFPDVFGATAPPQPLP